MTVPRIPCLLRLSFALGIVPFLAAAEPALAQTTAGDVVNRSSLRSFVERAATVTESSVSSSNAAYAFFDRTFRPTGEWRRGSVYIFVIDTRGVIRFHGANRSLEGRSLYNHRDRNGVYYTRELIAAAEAGGGFVEYLFDNPEIPGDDESPKVSYAEFLSLSGERLLIGSGFYPADSAPIAPPLALLALATLLAGGAYRRWRQR